MLFSIIIPLYNNEKYIQECIESVINQSEQSFELIIVNDGSTDKSKEIVEEYKSKHFNIKLINQKNKGLLHTRCIGVECAIGEFIVFVDSDDKIKPDTLKILKKHLLSDNLDMVIYNLARFDEKKVFSNSENVFQDCSIFEKNNKEKIFEQLLISSKINSMCLKVVRRDCFDCEEILAYPDVRNGEDLLHTLPVITNAKKIKYIDEVLYLYRINNESMTRVFNYNNYTGIGIRYNALKKYLRKWEMDKPKYFSLLNKYYLRDIAKIAVYHKNNVKGFEKDYHDMLREIINDSIFNSVYTNSFTNLSLTYKIPIWLIKNNHFNTTFYFKKVVAMIRK